MTGATGLGVLGILGVLLAGLESDRAGWDACDRLDPSRAFPAEPGPWAEVGLRSWEALPEAVQMRGRGGVEPRRGLGGYLGWLRLETGDGSAAEVLGMAGVVRRDRIRFELGAEEARFAGGKLHSGWARLLVSVHPGWVLGGTLEAVPGLPAGAPTVAPEVWGGGGVWRLGIRFRDRVEASVGLLVRPGLSAWARVEGGTPGVGVALAWGGVDLGGEASDHAYLGRIAHVRLRLRRGGGR